MHGLSLICVPVKRITLTSERATVITTYRVKSFLLPRSTAEQKLILALHPLRARTLRRDARYDENDGHLDAQRDFFRVYIMNFYYHYFKAVLQHILLVARLMRLLPLATNPPLWV